MDPDPLDRVILALWIRGCQFLEVDFKVLVDAKQSMNSDEPNNVQGNILQYLKKKLSVFFGTG